LVLIRHLVHLNRLGMPVGCHGGCSCKEGMNEMLLSGSGLDVVSRCRKEGGSEVGKDKNH
jgi:hypothetical protein